MNFLLRATSPATSDLPTPAAAAASAAASAQTAQKRGTTLDDLIAEDSPEKTSVDGGSSRGSRDDAADSAPPHRQIATGNHSDVEEDQGWITIPNRELPDDWNDASDILQLQSFDRSFVFPGEQLHILVCLLASKQDTEIITPFKIAAVMSKNGGSGKKQVENLGEVDINGVSEEPSNQIATENGDSSSSADVSPGKEDISATESLLRMEDHKHQTETLLERFRNSNFFVRFAQSDEPLWSKRNDPDLSSKDSEVAGGKRSNFHNATIDRGSFDGNTSGGVARNTVRCYSLRNGDIVVLLKVNVAVSNVKDPVLEVLQFEKCGAVNAASGNGNRLLIPTNEDPCRGLLNWLLPLDPALPPRPLSPPLNSSSALGNVPRSISTSSTSQIFSFGHFRSYSMPTLPPINGPPSAAIPSSNSKPAFDLEDCNRFSQDKMLGHDAANDGLLSFRGVPLEPERFAVHCGLEGIYLPGKRWRRKIEIVQPIEIHSFVAECTTDDILCVQVKNVSPAHLPDIIIYLDAIAIVFEEATKGAPPLSLPIASIETGDGHSLPNLSLRRGEEHSFILKPSSIIGRDLKGHSDSSSRQSHQKMGSSILNVHQTSRVSNGKKVAPSADQYAVLVSCRCNYSESKLFFKQPTSWKPRVARDLMISVVSEISEPTGASNGRVPQLPVQVLTLQASNLTSEDLTLTVLAPISSNSSPSVLPLSPAPRGSLVGFPEITGRTGGVQRVSSMPVERESQKDIANSGKRSISLAQRTGATSDIMPSSDSGCTHLWLQSKVPLGCVPACSSATVKLELLPLTDGIISLDTLQVAVKEKGLTYIPEQALKIHATSSIASGIV
ncbi:uncharacterized protein M6B38_287115 [Iris pallida]|uniref:Uncharacterized protein n=2 Tax=Iris pallida TaxID=29817 RepID=A0AAX6HX40_IRIPA|nr:uncharacterized protein M6B38_287115 [Iris pallida]